MNLFVALRKCGGAHCLASWVLLLPDVCRGRRDPWGADPLQSRGELTTSSLRIKEKRSWPWNSPPWSTRSKAVRSPIVCRGHWREMVSAGNQHGRSAAALEERERGSSSDRVERRSRRQGLPERFADERRSSSGYWVCFLWSPRLRDGILAGAAQISRGI
jgi:hypothetical protein